MVLPFVCPREWNEAMLLRARGFRTGSVASIPWISASLSQAAESLARNQIERRRLCYLGRAHAVSMILAYTAEPLLGLMGGGGCSNLLLESRSSWEKIE